MTEVKNEPVMYAPASMDTGGPSSSCAGPDAGSAPMSSAAAGPTLDAEMGDSVDLDAFELNECVGSLLALGSSAEGSDIVELFCPWRLKDRSSLFGLTHGGAFDLRTGWDLSLEADRKRCWATLLELEPSFVLGSPKCAPFSVLQHLNKETPEGQARYDEGLWHLQFVSEVYAWQNARGAYFLHEHPWRATSWKLDCISKVMELEGVELRRGDQCRFGLKLKDRDGEEKLALSPREG